MTPFWKSVFFFYMGLVFITISLRGGENVFYSDLLMLCIGSLGGGFLTYGVIVFIGDIRKSKSIREVLGRIRDNLKRGIGW